RLALESWADWARIASQALIVLVLMTHSQSQLSLKDYLRYFYVSALRPSNRRHSWLLIQNVVLLILWTVALLAGFRDWILLLVLISLAGVAWEAWKIATAGGP